MKWKTRFENKAPALGLVLGLLLPACRRLHDEGRELVNAAGRSVPETLTVLRSGADVNKPSYSHFGWTPLISAIYHHKEDVVDLLLTNRADPNLGDDDNRTALVWAVECWGQNTNLLVKLIQHGADPRKKTKLDSDAFTAARSRPDGIDILEVLEKAEAERAGILKHRQGSEALPRGSTSQR